MSYQPILEDSVQIASLDGQRFVVLRAPEAVAMPWRTLQQGLRRELTGPVFYPATAHLTLMGFVAGTSLDDLAAVVRAWSSQTPAQLVEAEQIDTFPPPARIAGVRVRKTAELAAALGALRERATAAGLTPSATVPIDQWTPRMSLVYGGRLDEPAWQHVLAVARRHRWPIVAGEVAAAEVLAFDDGREHTGGQYALGR